MATLANTRGESLTGSADFLANALNQRRQGINAAEAQAAQQSAIQQALGQALQGGAQGGSQQPINTKAMASLMAIDSDLGKNVLDIMQSNDEMARTQAQQAIEKQGKRAKFIQNQKGFAGKQRALKSLAMEMAAEGEDISKISDMLNMSEQDLDLQLQKRVMMAQKADDVFKPATARTDLGKATQDLREGFISQEQFDKMQEGGVAEKGTFTKGTPVLIRGKDGKEAFATPVTDSRDGSTRTVVTEIPGAFLNRLGQTSNEDLLQAITKAGGTTEAQKAAELKTAAKIKSEEKKGAAEQARIQGIIDKGIAAADSIPIANRGLELLKSVKTGGISSLANYANSVLGIQGANELELSNALSRNVLSQLRETFGAAFTAQEGQQLQNISEGFGKSTAGNIRLLERTLMIARRAAKKGIRTAEKNGDIDTANDIRSAMEFSLSPDTLPEGVTEEDITETMRAMSMTREQVLERLKNGG